MEELTGVAIMENAFLIGNEIIEKALAEANADMNDGCESWYPEEG